MGDSTCCVVNCKNNEKNSSCKFYSFPTSKWTLQQRQKWIAAVKRKNADGTPWHPKRHDTICSEHFIGGKNCFRPAYSDTRVIIDCTEFRIEVPSAVDDRVACYSHYKKGFTAKVVVGITPGGLICFKSKVAGGRKTDSQMTVEFGLIDKLEMGDLVLAVKGFPEIKKVINTSGKEIKVVMPPFLQNKNEFTKEETQQTYDIARVRIHVERIMQRLRVYRILDKIPHNLFDCIDNIVHVCCVLVNLQPSIFDNINNSNRK